MDIGARFLHPRDVAALVWKQMQSSGARWIACKMSPVVYDRPCHWLSCAHGAQTVLESTMPEAILLQAVQRALDRVELNASQTTMELAAHYLP